MELKVGKGILDGGIKGEMEDEEEAKDEELVVGLVAEAAEVELAVRLGLVVMLADAGGMDELTQSAARKERSPIQRYSSYCS